MPSRVNPNDQLSIMVAGMVAGHPGQGGAAWAVLQYVLGLRALGHEVTLVEPVTVPAEQTIRDTVALPARSRRHSLISAMCCRRYSKASSRPTEAEASRSPEDRGSRPQREDGARGR